MNFQTPTPADIQRMLDAGKTHLPLVRRRLSDFDTPLSIFNKVANQPWSYLLESLQGGERWGRYSIIGLPAQRRVEINAHEIRVFEGHNLIEKQIAQDPLAWVEAFHQRICVQEVPGLPKFFGGLVGYFGYDTIRMIEPKLAKTQLPDPLAVADILLLWSEDVIVFDNLAGEVLLVALADLRLPEGLAQAHARLDAMEVGVMQPTTLPKSSGSLQLAGEDFVSEFGEEAFKASVARIKEYILAGDVMQVVLSQRMTAPFDASPLALYRALRHLNPSPYMYCLNLDTFHIVGSSPEILVQVQEGEVTVRPIAGTRKRGATPEEDLALEQDLLADPKEIAEHLMLIDLGRNDVGRVAQVGQVRLTDKMVIERYSHVMHIVSNVVGKLQPNLTAMDALKATFPAGTLSGAPKIRAMEIIDELEPSKRGIYGGAVGYWSWDGSMDLAIAIRTAIIKNNTLYLQAGAGIVADSDPQSEWEETLNKGRAIVRALGFMGERLK